MTQKQLIIEYIKEFGCILPAKMGGKVYLGHMFGSETPKRCRELRSEGRLDSEREGRFEKFYFKSLIPTKAVDLRQELREPSHQLTLKI